VHDDASQLEPFSIKPTQEQVGLKSHGPCCGIHKEYTCVSKLVTPLHISAVEFWRWLTLKENVFFAGVLKSWEEWEGKKLWVGARQGKMTTYSIPCKNLKTLVGSQVTSYNP
jgi:hypothetical protein